MLEVHQGDLLIYKDIPGMIMIGNKCKNNCPYCPNQHHYYDNIACLFPHCSDNIGEDYIFIWI